METPQAAPRPQDPVCGMTVSREVASAAGLTADYEGQSYRSLSAVAKAVTGSHWNGHLFFGLTKGVRR